MLQASLKKHDVARVQARIRRHNQTLTAPQQQGRAVTVLKSDDVIGTACQCVKRDSDIGVACQPAESIMLWLCPVSISSC